MKNHKNKLKFSDPAEASRIYILPNLFTAGNLFFGFLAIIRCIQAKYVVLTEELSKNYYEHAVWFIFLAVICDAMDGRVARISGRESLFGKEFDSIADIVSFGVAPALMVFFLILSPTEDFPFFQQLGWIIGFIYLLCAGVRLARFNVITNPLVQKMTTQNLDTNGSLSYFRGLPVPPAAGVVSSLVLVLLSYNLKAWALLLPFLLILISVLMVSNIHYPSFKNVNWQTRTAHKTFIFVVVLAIIVFLFREISLAIIFLTYVFYGIFSALRKYNRSRKSLSSQMNNSGHSKKL